MTSESLPSISQHRHSLRGRAQQLPQSTTSGLLVGSAGLPLLFVPEQLQALQFSWELIAAIDACILLLVAGAILPLRPRGGRILATIAALLTLVPAWRALVREPTLALFAGLMVCISVVQLYKWGTPLLPFSRLRRRVVREGQAQGTSLAAAGHTFFVLLAEPAHTPLVLGALTWSIGLATALSVDWAWSVRHSSGTRAPLLVTGSYGAALLLSALALNGWWGTLLFFGLATFASTALVRPQPLAGLESVAWWEPLLGHPERFMVGTFVGLSLVGMLLLALPLSSSTGHSIGLVDALFTSTSAVCVTGLIVLDTPQAFGGFGQVVLLLLIQVGGLGIMTLSTVAFWALGQRMSLRHEGTVAVLIGAHDRGKLVETATRILRFTFVVEAIGAFLLFFAFIGHGDSALMALWRAVFTSISAFCNAGFALQTDSLIPYQHSSLVLHVISLLIILGGLSPVTALALPRILRRSPEPVSAQVWLGLSTAGILLVGGFIAYLTLEWHDSLRGLGLLDRVNNAWFQSVTMRTAGFNSVDLTIVRPATLTILLFLMFVGGNPGGTAGGVKTTTIAILALSVSQAITGGRELVSFGKTIPTRTREKAAVVVVVAGGIFAFALLAIQLTQNMPTDLAVFEVTSALGTVGLTIGGTGMLDGIGKVIIILCMLIGRVGGLTVLMFLSQRTPGSTWHRPEEAVDVG